MLIIRYNWIVCVGIFIIGFLSGILLNQSIYSVITSDDVVVNQLYNHEYKKKFNWHNPILLLNATLYTFVFLANGFQWESVLYCILVSILLAISVIDLKTYEIPPQLNLLIGLLGIINLGFNFTGWSEYVSGFFSVSGFLYLIFLATKGKGIGGGDIKLMAAAGLLLGYKKVILAFFLGCILGSVIHLARMKIRKEEHILALGPYLAAGIFLSALYGEQMLKWYFHLLGVSL
ncbi:prepilin peptidase [Velocimicrobium porci]|uniref:Prepilin peptidase n=1 Tax=Velocimicrobium porci TaxID=2606634 RepID=A0A6L5XWB0_9FIRM|nr:prepilin peptidase [Velocimicrobium porci]MSS63105.1 prepilin peptidase [Velocimicrobium porci]